MADINVEAKQGGNMRLILAGGAIIAIVALMVWLFSTQTTTTQVVTDDTIGTDAVEVEEASTAEVAELSAVGANPDAFAGRPIRVDDVDVAAILGERGFWADVPGANPFLVILAAEAGDAGWLDGDAELDMEGTVEPVTDEVLDAWVADGTIREQARDEAAFATHYFNATDVDVN